MKKKKSKATERRAYGVTILKSSHSRIRGLKVDHEPEIHGDKFWNSSFLIMDYLQHQGLPKKPKVMEVGCGWGLAAIYCAKEHGAEVTGVDADSKVFPYLHLHAEVNEVAVRTRRALFQGLKKKHLVGQVIVADPGRPPFDKVCEKAEKKLGGEVKEWKIDDGSVKTSGWLLIVGSLPAVGKH